MHLTRQERSIMSISWVHFGHISWVHFRPQGRPRRQALQNQLPE